jgi:hypothetical protein
VSRVWSSQQDGAQASQSQAFSPFGQTRSLDALAIVPLWGLNFSSIEDAVRTGMNRLGTAKQVVLVQLVDEEVVDPDLLPWIEDQGLAVVSVSAEHRDDVKLTASLEDDVRSGLDDLQAGATDHAAPAVDKALAKRVAEANGKLQRLASKDVQDFLAEHYQLSDVDDGTR